MAPLSAGVLVGGLLMLAALGHAMQLTLTIRYPLAAGSTLYLRGSALGLSWDTGVPVKPAPAVGVDTFQYVVDVPPAQFGRTLQFKTLVNDADWQVGANEQVVLPEDPAEVVSYPFFYSTAGEYRVLPEVYSPVLKNSRHPVVYTPPSYHENPYKPMRNVLVMHDGQNLFNDSTSFMVAWHCQDTINKLVVEGGMEEVAIVGLYNTPDRNDEYTYSYDPTEKMGGKGDLYLDFIEQVALPAVVKQYPRFKTDPDSLGILGSSLGGLISCYAGWTRSRTYGRAGCMSSSFWWNGQDFVNVTMPSFGAPVPETFYLDSGSAGPGRDDEFETLAVRHAMEELGFVLNRNLFYYLDVGGEHNEVYWGRRFHVPMTALYPPSPLAFV